MKLVKLEQFWYKPKRLPEHSAVNRSVVSSSLSGAAIFVVRKSYKTQKAQDLVGLVLFVAISCGSRLSRNI